MRRFTVLSFALLFQGCGGSSGGGSGGPDNEISLGTGDQVTAEAPCPHGKPFFMNQCWDEVHIDIRTYSDHSAYLEKHSGERLELFKMREPFNTTFDSFIYDQARSMNEKYLPLGGCFLDDTNNDIVLGACRLNLRDDDQKYGERPEPHLFSGTITTKEGTFSLPVSQQQLKEVSGEQLDHVNFQYLDDGSRIIWEHGEYLEVITMWPTGLMD